MESRSKVAPLIIIVGETATGKTAAAIKLAQKIDGEIICADSRTIYKQMDISTAKPTPAERKLVKHYLLDEVEPSEYFSVAEFKNLAKKCIQTIRLSKKMPIVVGGTGLYIDALLYDFHFGGALDKELRDELEQMNIDKLTTLLHQKGISEEGLNTKNKRHLIRAIERGGVIKQTLIPRQNTLVLGIKLDRDLLRKRITSRVNQMFTDGFIDEIKAITDKYGWDNQSISGKSYQVVRDYLEGGASEEQVKEAFVSRDLSLAKKQRTWFKRNADIIWFEDPEELIDKAVEFAAHFHYN